MNHLKDITGASAVRAQEKMIDLLTKALEARKTYSNVMIFYLLKQEQVTRKHKN